MSEPLERPGFDDYVQTYQATRKRDKATLAGAAGSTALGGAVGGLGATGIASWFGATGVSGLGVLLGWLPAGLVKVLGITATVTTPVGWVLGSVAVCACLGFGIYKLSHSGGQQDERRRVLGQGLLTKIQSMCQRRAENIQHPVLLTDQTDLIAQVESLFRELGQERAIAADKVDHFVANLKSGRLPLDDAIAILREHGKELAYPTLDPAAPSAEAALRKAASARAFTALHKGVMDDPDQPGDAFLGQMRDRFGIDRGRALDLYRDAPLDPHPTDTARQLAEIFDQEVIQGAFAALEDTARSLRQGQAAFVRFLEVQQALQAQFNAQVGAIDLAGAEAWEAIGRL